MRKSQPDHTEHKNVGSTPTKMQNSTKMFTPNTGIQYSGTSGRLYVQKSSFFF